ncbi:F-type H+-transporting ATPase subunit delta [Kineococcus radiotolerans]|uniref:ATP synthase subunit delta n=2 Tax=Kineococcus radiotolerans TaxID=131568 RepID=ATPD_KINRD|nr:F0F1 ATP synthase subunit delta [Kineococcus radiotolerans]A6W7G6.1 RecName: Full=ATP synthase subunit delta; AltName: Full=ATP synthase F(1) sector subunit delta; AltName: Full=F-type ATPase subunit delta; Short=F-ATPase subunit delta [Kineococcus radiotolerans SRS30216 = ATCC BAA-149]ABS02755.1 ATP synthase F1, delta subunit [Kineococcus radiotolerans SRS30216 = ATCC BAA-149]MBB2900054.1 F-type H+-transporting ATPase subunit delta [Kineococcus radiotolerans]
MSGELDAGVAKASLAAAQQVLDVQLSAEGADAGKTGEDLFAVTSLLDSSVGLRRALTDPSRSGAAKAEFVRRTLSGRITPAALETVVALASARWAAGRDLSDATERLAVVAVVTQAERSGHLDALEDELFRFARTVAGSPALRDALADRTAPDANRASLAARLLLGKASPETVQLARRAASSSRGMRAERLLEEWVEVVAKRREQLVAHVVSATPLTDAQRERLAATLSRQYGRAIRVNLDVDPHLVGGLRVSVGDDVIDGSISTRLDEARRRLAG